MKKSILFVFALIPMLASCNNSGNGFDNPFPEDDYHPTGFNFSDDERVSRPLTTTEQTLVNETCAHPNNELVTQHSITIQTRDYTRAFAGQFEQGYSASNTKETKEIYTFRQNQTSEHLNDPLKRRTVTHIDTDAVYDYSYGRNTSNVKTDEWHYYALGTTQSDGSTTYEENENHTDTPSEKQEFIISQIKSSESKTNTGKILAKAAIKNANTEYAWEEGVEDATFNIGLEHSEFLTKLSDCSSTPGADKDGNIILVNVNQKKYRDPNPEVEEGIYQLQDGRMYQAMENSLKVSKLVLQSAKRNEEGDPWYLVSYARRYTEITITSEVIQPNVPITMLSKPIVISYIEEIHYFKTSKPQTSTDELDPVTIEDEK